MLLAAGFYSRQWIKDQYVVRTTALEARSQAVASDLELTDGALFTYKASQPKIENANEFNKSCQNVAREQSIVLGCYTVQQIFVYNVTDERLNGVIQVTAAHELLHAVYDRMPSAEKSEVNALLEQTAQTIDNQRFKDTLAEYRRTEPDQIDNELHSIIGTEIAVLPSSLETHYQKYFKNRQKIVSYAKQYEQTFTDIDAQIKQYDAQLTDLKSQKEALESTLNSEQAAIEAEGARMKSLRSSGQILAYNAAVPGYNQSISIYNANIARLKQIVVEYNSIVEERNKLATTQNDLTKQLDSNYQTLQ